MAPRSMALRDGTLVGLGVAGGCYPAPTTPTIATLRITADGGTRFAVLKAVAQIKAQLVELADGRVLSGTVHQQLAATRRPFLQVEASNVAPGQDAKALDKLRSGEFARGGPDNPDFATFSYIAHFVDVRVEPGTRRIRAPRVVSVADGGRIVSPRTAAS